jgi:hypothetical protein
VIKLTKLDKPAILEANEKAWTAAIVNKVAAGVELTDVEKARYRHPDIKARLIEETHGKCAYCESKVLHIAYGDIEHVVLKSLRPELTGEWSNLTLACDRRNTNKGSYCGDHERILDPYATEPLDHLYIVGPLVLPKPGNDAGTITERTLKLNRTEVVERRIDRINHLHALFDNLNRTTDPAVKQVLLSDIQQNELADTAEYAAVSRAFAQPSFEHLE